MKRNLLFIAIIILTTALVFSACQTKSAVSEKVLDIPAADTAGLAAFQEWKAINERKSIEEYQQQQVAAQAVTPPTRTTTARKKTSTQPVASTAPVATKKKGWSKAAKGAVIGTTTGAVAGVLIGKKNKVLGGVIGGVVGGGLGYVIGRDMDKRDGRVK